MLKIKVTNNEYQEKLKEAVDKLYDKINPIKTIDEIMDQYEIIPFKTGNKIIDTIVNNYCTTEEKREAGKLYRGHIASYTMYNYRYESGYTMIYDNGYSIALYNDKLNILLSYCEGDFTAETFENKEAYNQGKNNTIQWYKDNQ